MGFASEEKHSTSASCDSDVARNMPRTGSKIVRARESRMLFVVRTHPEQPREPKARQLDPRGDRVTASLQEAESQSDNRKVSIPSVRKGRRRLTVRKQ